MELSASSAAMDRRAVRCAQAMTPLYDTVIVGAGPAGSLTAWRLALAGFRVVVLEASERIGRKVCGEYLAPSGVRLLGRLGLEPWLAGNFRTVKGMKLAAPSGRIVETRFPAHGGRASVGYALNREAFDRGLLELARAAGAEVRMGFRVRELALVDGAYSVCGSDGVHCHGRLLIGADGRRSIVARRLGLSVEQKPSRVALHCYLQARRPGSHRGEMHILPGGTYVGINPVEAGLANCSVICDASWLKAHAGPRGAVQAVLAHSPALSASFVPPPADAPIRATYPITHRVRDCIAERAALVGDAAGFIDPLTGEGINNALWMADALSEELIAARDEGRLEAPRGALRRYARRKRRLFRQKGLLNRAFQRVIRSQPLTEALGAFLARSQSRADAFIGIVGNVYPPAVGLARLLGAPAP
jgi:flavin-dependent dehydrogenase